MKIYRAWTDSNHKITYTLGYCRDKKNAEKLLNITGPKTAASPDYGVEEIELLDGGTCETCKHMKSRYCDFVSSVVDGLDFYCAKFEAKEDKNE